MSMLNICQNSIMMMEETMAARFGKCIFSLTGGGFCCVSASFSHSSLFKSKQYRALALFLWWTARKILQGCTVDPTKRLISTWIRPARCTHLLAIRLVGTLFLIVQTLAVFSWCTLLYTGQLVEVDIWHGSRAVRRCHVRGRGTRLHHGSIVGDCRPCFDVYDTNSPILVPIVGTVVTNT